MPGERIHMDGGTPSSLLHTQNNKNPIPHYAYQLKIIKKIMVQRI